MDISNRLKCLLTLLLILCNYSPAADGANILGIFLSEMTSHVMVQMSVVKVLAERGHNVTVVLSKKPLVDHPAINKIIITPKHNIFQEEMLKKMFEDNPSLIRKLITTMDAISMFHQLQYDAVLDERFQNFYKADNKFDLLMVGYMFNDFLWAIAAHYKCPTIAIWATAPMNMIHDLIGNPYEVAYAQVGMNPLLPGFFGRVGNYITHVVMKAVQIVGDMSSERRYNTLLLDKENSPSYKEMKHNISLVFVNDHNTESGIRPNVPAYVEIGGIHIKQKPDALPNNIAEFLDNSKEHGAILLTLGSIIKSTLFPKRTIHEMYTALSTLKQNVIWKWEDPNNIPGNATNILYSKWVPQTDILAHPNIKLFITHAGKGGVAESLYYKKPMVALPIFGDHPACAKKLVAAGYGIELNYETLKAGEFKAAILEVLNNAKYTENVKRFSQIYLDRPMNARDSVIYWTEYVLRYNGAKHLQSPLVHLNYIQTYSWDVIAFLLLIFYATWRIIKFVARRMWRMCCKRNTTTKRTDKKLKRQ